MNFTLMICDDEQIYRNAIIKELSTIIDQYAMHPKIVEVSDGFEVLEYLEEESVDVLFMDIEMCHLNGIDTAKAIRKKDENMLIVFITAHATFALQSYDVQAFDYILKNKLTQLPKKYDRLMDALEEKINLNSHSIIVGMKNEVKKILVRDIYYIEVDAHRSKIYLKDKMLLHGEKVSVLENALKEEKFIRCHNSFLVNLNRIEGIVIRENINYFELENGEFVEISRRRKKEAMEAFLEGNRRV